MSDRAHIEKMLSKLGAKLLWTWNIDPLGKPRMTRRDRWKKRPVVERFYAFRDQLVLTTPPNVMERLKDSEKLFAWVVFHKMPKSYSGNKRQKLMGMAMRQKPDVDNVVKAILDSLLTEDKEVHFLWTTQLWSTEGKILVYEIPKSL